MKKQNPFENFRFVDFARTLSGHHNINAVPMADEIFGKYLFLKALVKKADIEEELPFEVRPHVYPLCSLEDDGNIHIKPLETPRIKKWVIHPDFSVVRYIEQSSPQKRKLL